jgi:general secretion pathway protein K
MSRFKRLAHIVLTKACSMTLVSVSVMTSHNHVCAKLDKEKPDTQSISGGPFDLNVPPSQTEAQARGGFVLLIVLEWLTFLLLVVAQITAATRTAILISSNIHTRAVAEAQADGAANEAIFNVLAQNWNADGITHIIRGPQAVSEVRVENEGGRIDPNVAPVILLQALLSGCGARPAIARDVATTILEWRSINIRQLAGSDQGSRYRAAGRPYTAPNTRFVSVDELGLVLGMTPELLACLEPHVSVYSLSVPSVASTSDPVVRQALARAYPYDTAQPVATAETQVEVVRIIATARGPDGSKFRRVAIVRIASTDPSESFTYRILSWE